MCRIALPTVSEIVPGRLREKLRRAEGERNRLQHADARLTLAEEESLLVSLLVMGRRSFLCCCPPDHCSSCLSLLFLAPSSPLLCICHRLGASKQSGRRSQDEIEHKYVAAARAKRAALVSHANELAELQRSSKDGDAIAAQRVHKWPPSSPLGHAAHWLLCSAHCDLARRRPGWKPRGPSLCSVRERPGTSTRLCSDSNNSC